MSVDNKQADSGSNEAINLGKKLLDINILFLTIFNHGLLEKL